MAIKPEKQLQDKAIAYLKSKGIYAINEHGGGFAGKGKPDLITCIKGKFVAFELKVGNNDMQDDQKLHKLWIERSGGLHYAPYTLEEFILIVNQLLEA